MDCITWFGDGAYFSPQYPECLFVVGDAYNLWERSDLWITLSVFKPIWDLPNGPLIVDAIGALAAPFGYGPILGGVHMLTHRTEQFMLSSTQDYHGGYMAGQAHPWQATFDPHNGGSTVFSHQPRSSNPDDVSSKRALKNVPQKR